MRLVMLGKIKDALATSLEAHRGALAAALIEEEALFSRFVTTALFGLVSRVSVPMDLARVASKHIATLLWNRKIDTTLEVDFDVLENDTEVIARIRGNVQAEIDLTKAPPPRDGLQRAAEVTRRVEELSRDLAFAKGDDSPKLVRDRISEAPKGVSAFEASMVSTMSKQVRAKHAGKTRLATKESIKKAFEGQFKDEAPDVRERASLVADDKWLEVMATAYEAGDASGVYQNLASALRAVGPSQRFFDGVKLATNRRWS